MRMLLLCLALAMVSCVPMNTTPSDGQDARGAQAQAAAQQPSRVATASKAPTAGVTREMMLNLSFHEPDVAEQRVVFTNGKWLESDTNKKCDLCSMVWEVAATAVGDLDGDKVDNGVFLVASHGATIHMQEYLLFAVTVKNGKVVLTRGLNVGDKSFVFKSLSIKDGKVRLVEGLAKGRTAASQYVLRSGALVRVKGR